MPGDLKKTPWKRWSLRQSFKDEGKIQRWRKKLRGIYEEYRGKPTYKWEHGWFLKLYVWKWEKTRNKARSLKDQEKKAGQLKISGHKEQCGGVPGFFPCAIYPRLRLAIGKYQQAHTKTAAPPPGPQNLLTLVKVPGKGRPTKNKCFCPPTWLLLMPET